MFLASPPFFVCRVVASCILQQIINNISKATMPGISKQRRHLKHLKAKQQHVERNSVLAHVGVKAKKAHGRKTAFGNALEYITTKTGF